METHKKLDKANVQDITALTPMQEAMLFQYLRDEQSTVYCEQIILELSGPIQPALLQKTWAILGQQNDALRSLFRWQEIKEPVRIVLRHHTPQLHIQPLPSLTQPQTVLDMLKEETSKPLALYEVPFHLHLYQETMGKFYLVIIYHHILFDGWSLGCLLKEMVTLYAQLLKGIEPAPEVKTPFKQYVRWLQTRDKVEEKAFWQSYWAGCDIRTEMPFDNKHRGNVDSLNKCSVTFSTQEAAAIGNFVKKILVTPSAFIYTAWGILLQKYTGSRDVTFGTIVSGRHVPLQGIDNLVGLFINSVPLRLKATAHSHITALIQQTQKDLIARQPFETSALGDIKNYVGLNQSETPFDTYVTIENYPLAKHLLQKNGVLEVTNFAFKERTDLDLELLVWLGDGIAFELTYNERRYSEAIADAMAVHLKNLMNFMAAHGDTRLSEIVYLADNEKVQLLSTFNPLRSAYDVQEMAYLRIQNQARQHPEKIAIQSIDRQLSYQALDEKSNYLARILRQQGVRPGSIVALLTQDRFALIVGMLSTWKAGGAYVPIDPEYPQKRIEYILQDTQAPHLLAVKETFPDLPFSGIRLNLDELDAAAADISPWAPVNTPTDPAYIIYTSGTTGNPKGVVVSQQNLTAYLHAFQNVFQLTDDDTALHVSSPSFDATVEEIFPVLMEGGTIFVGDRKKAQDIGWLSKTIPDRRITLISSAPLMLNELNHLDSAIFAHMKLIISGGDVLKWQYVDRLSRAVLVCNIYGPAEATVGASFYPILPDHKHNHQVVPIGKPIANYTFYILDPDQNLLPVGIPGEIYIGGDGVALGYLKRPRLTAEKFVPNPYGEGRLYRTGDRGRWLADGNIEFLGRVDEQISFMGHRLEPGEVETALLEYEGIEAVAVLFHDTTDHKILTAYIAAADHTPPLNLTQLRQFLHQTLPPYMVPSEFILVKQIPRTINGKVDRRALAAEKNKRLTHQTAYQAPHSALQQQVVTVWQEVLGLPQVGVSDNLFELGGNSLSVIRLKNQLSKQLNQDIPITTFFEYPTIATFTDYLSQATAASEEQDVDDQQRRLQRKKATLLKRRTQQLARS